MRYSNSRLNWIERHLYYIIAMVQFRSFLGRLLLCKKGFQFQQNIFHIPSLLMHWAQPQRLFQYFCYYIAKIADLSLWFASCDFEGQEVDPCGIHKTVINRVSNHPSQRT